MKRNWIIVCCLVVCPGRFVPGVAAEAWWDAFGNSGLSAAIEQGLADHPDPAGALARIKAATSMVTTEQSERRPMAMADVSYRWGREKTEMSGGTDEDVNPLMASARVSWEIDLFGRVGASIDAAEAEVAMRVADAEAIRLLLSLEIAQSYFEIARMAEELSWINRSLEDIYSLRDRASRRVEAGLDEPGALRSAEADVRTMQHERMEFEAMQDMARAKLRSLLGGKNPPAFPEAIGVFTLPAIPDMTGTNLYLSRPDVVAAYQYWQAAEGAARSASLDRLPSLALVASAAGEGEGASDPETWSAWAGPMLTVPLWQPQRGSKARGAAAGADAAEAMFASASLRAMEEIDAARASRERSEAMINHMSDREKFLAAEEESVARKREAGLVQEADWRMARMERAEAARRRAVWIAAGLTDHVNLVSALGGSTSQMK